MARRPILSNYKIAKNTNLTLSNHLTGIWLNALQLYRASSLSLSKKVPNPHHMHIDQLVPNQQLLLMV